MQCQPVNSQEHPDPFDLRNNAAEQFEAPEIRDLHFDEIWTGEWDHTAPEAALPKLNETDRKTLMLRWHYRLGHMPFRHIKASAKAGLLDPRLRKCKEMPFCPGCQFGKASKRQWRHRSKKKDGTRVKPPQAPYAGAVVSLDTMNSTSVPGLMPQLRGIPTLNRFHYATVFVDHYSDLSYVHLHQYNDAAAVLEAKLAFERYAGSFGVRIKHYRCDNGVFADNSFKAACRAARQTQSFCGTNAHHQNGKAEKRIRDLRDSARSMLLLAKHNWPAAITPHLWGFAMIYASQIRNSLVREAPKGKGSKGTPLQRFSGTSANPSTKVFHTFGCPIYNLDPRLQSGHTLENKWTDRARIGIFLGLSREHATSVSIVLNPATGLVTPQFHVTHDERFETVGIPAMKDVGQWQGKTRIHERRDVKKPKTSRSRKRARLNEPGTNPMEDTNLQVEQQASSGPSEQSTPVGPAPSPVTGQPVHAPGPPVQPPGHSVHGPSVHAPSPFVAPTGQPLALAPQREQHLPSQREASAAQRENPHQVQAPSASPPPPSQQREQEPSNRAQAHALLAARIESKRKRKRNRIEEEETTNSLEERRHELELMLHTYHTEIARRVHAEELVNECMTDNPFAFAATLADEDTMYLHQAKKEPDWPQFHGAMVKEIDDHTKGKHWEVVKRSSMPEGHKAMRGVWSMKRKRRVGTGEIYKHKARMCIDGSSQKHGINYWDTYSPVVAWETIRSLLTLAIMKGWHTRQIDFVLAFPQAEVECPMYMEIPRECYVEGTSYNQDHVLKLKKNLYGAKQAGKVWFEFLKEGLQDIGFKQSTTDKAVFFKGETIFVVYVDDGILMGPNEQEISDIIGQLGRKYKLTDEGNLNEYLGIKMAEQDDGSRNMTQPALIARILEVVGLGPPDPERDKEVRTPAVAGKVLHKDIGGKPRVRKWDYRSVVGMLNWLARSTRPDILFAVSQVGRFMAFPKLSHENAVMRICEYLRTTADKGMIMKPESGKGFEVYADADFAGGFHKGSAEDPSTAKSRTAYHVMFQGCLIYSHSKLQTEIALSTTEAEYICLSQALRTVIVLMRFFKELAKKVKCFKYEKPIFKCKAFEDNNGAIELATAEKLRPRTKHINLKYHHFKQAVKKKRVTIEKIDTTEQLADIGTKALDAKTFEYLRFLLIGW